MLPGARDSFGTRDVLETRAGQVHYYRLSKLSELGLADIARLPYSIKILLESVVRNENGHEVTRDDVERLARYNPKSPATLVIPYKPARVLMQDFTGVPCLVDLAALRSAMARFGKDPQRINPLLPVDLIIDHSVQVDVYGTPDAVEVNARTEFERNRERFEFLHWGQKAFRNFSVVPPVNGICHQVDLELIGKVVQRQTQPGLDVAYPDTLIGTDSHTPMINGLGVLGWGVGGIEAESVVLGEPHYILAPEVIGFRLVGELPEGTNATDLVLTFTRMLRDKGVVGKIVEFYGPGVAKLSLPDRGTISNMSPEMGPLAGFFPVDAETLNYLRYTGRTEDDIDLVERYCKAQGLFRTPESPDPEYKEILEFDLSTVRNCVAGPKRPQDYVLVPDLKSQWEKGLRAPFDKRGYNMTPEQLAAEATVAYPNGSTGQLKQGDVVIASITACVNTSNPWVLISSGILARNAVEAGLSVKPYVKTSFSPGSKVAIDYLGEAGLTPYLDELGFNNTGFGCMTCIGNSGPLPEHIATAIEAKDLVASAVLSGNRNFEGRVHPLVKANYLMSPPLVVAYALAGTVDIDLSKEPLGLGKNGQPVYLKDIWPTNREIAKYIHLSQNPAAFLRAYSDVETNNPMWNSLPDSGEPVYPWSETSTYIQEPPYFLDMPAETVPISPILGARVLVKAGNSVTTDHISPAGEIPVDSPAGRYMISRGIKPEDFNQYGTRRGNDRIMARGTFANVQFRNLLAPRTEGGWTTYLPTGEVMSIYDASLRYKEAGIPLIVLGGIDYGMGSSRDWAAKGVQLLGVKAVLTQSFETIHRSNLVGMGVLPLQFKPGQSAETLGLTGHETFSIHVDDTLKPRQDVTIDVVGADGDRLLRTITTTCRIDTPIEIEYYRHGGILHRALRRMLSE
jgi:aconitate hydratase